MGTGAEAMSNKSRCKKCNHVRGVRRQHIGEAGGAKKPACNCVCHAAKEKEIESNIMCNL